jgi:hypothetical protein
MRRIDATLFAFSSIVLFVWVPGEAAELQKMAAIASGVLVTPVAGEILIRRSSGMPEPQPTAMELP